MASQIKISVIVPAYREEKYIHNVLDGLRAQTFKGFETIIAMRPGGDRTGEIARSYGCRVLLVKKAGIGVARNRGAAAARGGILVFLDADTRPSPNLLRAYYDAFARRKIIAATGPIEPLERSSKRVRMGFKFVSVVFVKASIAVGRPSIVGLNFAVRKNAFKRVGGFDEKYATYEDWDLSLRLRREGQIAYLDDALAYTSSRRIRAWGVSGFFRYHVGNMARYHLLKRPKEYYEPIR
ncbi:MAG: glycosyltransferase [Candidatus Micrarchaeota archaeon]|nr:glycosyltransferase [Candidatus Micrarchaeota archaeon]